MANPIPSLLGRPSSTRSSSLALAVGIFLALAFDRPTRAVVIDDFADGSISSSQNAVGSGGGAAVGGLGGELDFELAKTAGDGPVAAGFNAAVAPGMLFAAARSTNEGTVELQWDGSSDDPASDVAIDGLGSVDLTDGAASNAVLVAIVSNDVATSLTLTIYSTGGTRSSSAVFTVPPVATPAILAMPFSLLAGDATFTDASAIVVVLDLSPGSDLLIDSVATGEAASSSVLPTGPSPSAFPLAIPAGSFLIDDFSGPGSSSTELNPGGSSTSSSIDPDSLGGHRTIFFENLTGTGSLAGERDGPAGRLWLHGGPLATGRVTLHWDGDFVGTFTPAGLGSVDLTSGGAHDHFLIGHAFADVAATLTFRVHSNGGTALSTGVLTIPALDLAGNVHDLPFDAFTGNADFTQVSALELEIEWALGLDLDLAFVAAGEALPAPQLAVEGNAIGIPSSDVTPQVDDGTDVGQVLAGTFVERTFTLRNDGDLLLNLALPATVAGDPAFTIEVQPATPLADGGGSTSLVVRYAPSGSGSALATVTILSDDPNSPYTFDVSGTSYSSVLEIPALDALGRGLLVLTLGLAAWMALVRRRRARSA